jgi:hypothetical protein
MEEPQVQVQVKFSLLNRYKPIKGPLNDLWKYDGMWTFVKGSTTANHEGVIPAQL